MTESLTAIIGLAAIVLIATGLGDLIGRGDRLRWNSASERFVFASAFGLGAVAYTVLFLGLIGQLRPLPIACVIALAAIIAHKRVEWFVRAGLSGMIGSASLWRQPKFVLLAISLIAISVFTLISALAPPNANDWDGLAYHLAMPKLFLEAHRIYHIDFSSHSNFPFTMEMLYTIGLAFGKVGLARAFNWWTAVLCCLGVYWLGRRHLGNTGRLAAIIFVGMPIVGWEATISYVDIGAAMFALMAAYAILNFMETGERSWLLRSAVFVGLSAGVKMTSLILIALFSVWTLIEIFVRLRRFGGALLWAVGYGITALLVASPWYIKTIIYTGNPVFPFFYSIFGGRGWNAQLAEIYRVSQMHFGIGTDFISLLKIPYALAFRPDRFYDVPSIMVSIGVVLICVIPIAFRLRYADKPAYPRLVAISMVQILIWCFMTQQSRYLMPALAILSAVAAYAVIHLSTTNMLRIVLIAVAVLQFTAAATLYGFGAFINAPPVFGLESRDKYLNRALDIYPAVKEANELPKNSKIVLFGDTRGFYLNREYLWGDASHNDLIPFARLGSPKDLAHALRKMRVTHVLINFKYLGKAAWEPNQPSALVRGAVDEGYFAPIYTESSRSIGLYKIKP